MSRQQDRDYLVFMTGAIVGGLMSILTSLITLPWWLHLPLFLAGLWVIFDVGRGWKRELKRSKR